MALILSDKSIDDTYSADVIQKAMELSPEIDEYVTTQKYLLETSDENLSPMWLRNKLMSIVLSQLGAMGITFSLEESVVLDKPELVQAALYLRSKFDNDNLYEFLKDHHDIDKMIREYTDDPDCVDDIAEYCAKVLPLDEGWECLFRIMNKQPGIIVSNNDFLDWLQDVFDRVDALGEPDVLTTDNSAVIKAYIEFLGKRRDQIEQVAKTIYGAVITTEAYGMSMSDAKVAAVEQYTANLEKELARVTTVETFDPEQHDIVLGNIRDTYFKKWPHTLGYWILPEHQQDVPTELDVAVMIATMYVDFGANSDARVKIIGALEEVADALGERYDKFRDMFDNALTNMVTVQEMR